MANVASNNNHMDPMNPRPLMDRLTHAVIKETSKNLKYYIDVKRRENAFVLNPNSIVCQSPPFRTKFIYGPTSDKTVRTILPNVPSKPKPINSTYLEKQMCREELNFHMRSYSFSPKETTKISEIRLKSNNTSSSSSASCSSSTRDIRSRSAFKLTRHEQNQLIDDTADIIASMIKSRRSIYEPNSFTQQTIPMNNSQNVNPSPRTIEENLTDLRTLSIKTPKRAFDDTFSKAMNIMQKSKLITKGFLCEYKISVFTGTCNGASTNAPIHIKLYGTNGHTNFQDLSHSQTHHVPFLKGQTDVFILQTYHVGDLVAITIGHNRKDMRASWFLNKISIEDQLRHRIYDIPCNSWLSIKSHDQRTIRDFPVLSTIPLKIKKEHPILNETQSDYSTTITVRTARSITTNPSDNDLLIEKKSRKQQQQHVSIGPTTVTQNPSTIDNHLNPHEFRSKTRSIHSPNLSSTSSDTELVGKIIHQTPSTTQTPSPTVNQIRLQSLAENEHLQTHSTLDSFQRRSIDHDRPPARLEKRHSSLAMSPDRINQQDDDETNNIFKFFQ